MGPAVSLEQLKIGRSYGKMLLKSRLMKLEKKKDGRTEQCAKENGETPYVKDSMKTQQLQTKKMVFLNRYSPCNCLVCWKNTGPGHCLNTVRIITILDVSQGDWYQNQEGVWKSGVWNSLGSYPQMFCLALGNGIISETRILEMV